MTTLHEALGLAARGMAIFPCVPRSKLPATKRGFYDATNNPSVLKRWFGAALEYNVAVRTGLASGIWVLDIDAGGEEGLRGLEEIHGPLPQTLTSQTASGLHFWWRASSPIPSSVGRIAPHVDARGENGYVVAPPSVHPTGVVYEWLVDMPPVPAPEWLADLARKPKRQAPAAVSHYPPSRCRPGAYCAFQGIVITNSRRS
jgi:hypothetical protein